MTLICLFKKNKKTNKPPYRYVERWYGTIMCLKKTPTLRFAMQSGKPLVSLFAARCLMVIFEDT